MTTRGKRFLTIGRCRLLVCALVVLAGSGPLMAQQGRGNRRIAVLERQLAELERALAALQGGGAEGTANSLAWSATISHESGAMVVAAAGENAGFVVFGACTAI